ncbi:MAG: hypothetical protein JWR80_3760 [Bradyrhizobium sp.]|jgi:hypothetical protein|nr:hypothetical protein [Bradyrhizobium sp.]
MGVDDHGMREIGPNLTRKQGATSHTGDSVTDGSHSNHGRLDRRNVAR